jgi:hypothetical protein
VITPPSPPELLAAFPELTAYGRTTTRLHPRPADVTVAESHIGGPLRWPADERWPTCTAEVYVQEDVPIPDELIARLRTLEASRTQSHVMAEGEFELHQEIERIVGPGYSGFGSVGGGPVVGHRATHRPHPRPNPMLALAQLRADDIPDLPRPGGTDLLQVLWCPDHHHEEAGFSVHLRWRREADVAGPFAEPPPSEIGERLLVPTACRLHPERVVEYPFPEELPDELVERIDDWDGDYVDLAMAPGWKVGGYANWSLTDLLDTPCPRCGGPTTLLLVIASSEYDGGTRERWQPADDPTPDKAGSPTGVTVGRWGSLRIFACLTCPDTPYTLDLQ